MFTPSNAADYRAAGIEVLSVYYSAIPFNGFGSFVPPLPFAARYNPIRLVPAEEAEGMTILPAYNHGDIVERGLSLRRWLRSMRRTQLAAGQGEDLLLVIDLDADDYFWEGFRIPLAGRLLPSFSGLHRLASSVADLPYVRFARPWDYLRAHPARLEVAFGQDMADGSWDGFASWAEKRENYEVWSLLDRARRVAGAAETMAGDSAPEGFAAARSEALSARVLALSTTHFGMASPVMNVERLACAFERAGAALGAGDALLELARGAPGRSSPVDGGGVPRRFLDPEIGTLAAGRGSLLLLDEGDDGAGLTDRLLDDPEEGLPRRCIATPTGPILDGTASIFATPRGEDAALGPEGFPSNAALRLEAAPDGSLRLIPREQAAPGCSLRPPAVRYGKSLLASRAAASARGRILGEGRAAELLEEGEIRFPGGQAAEWRRRFTLVAGLPYLYIDIDIRYPDTARAGYAREKASRLGRTWDARWREVMPCEILPELGASEGRPARVWKHNFEDRVSSYSIDYHGFGPNRRIPAINNHVTDGWVAVAGGKGGLLVAQSASRQTSFAFCPLRAELSRGGQDIRLNPFGTYFGPQLRYPTAGNGLGRLLSVRMGNQYDSYAPSWAGGTLRASMMVAPYSGDCPPEGLRRDALIFASLPVREDRRAGGRGLPA
jgi:hypothetical protein